MIESGDLPNTKAGIIKMNEDNRKKYVRPSRPLTDDPPFESMSEEEKDVFVTKLRMLYLPQFATPAKTKDEIRKMIESGDLPNTKTGIRKMLDDHREKYPRHPPKLADEPPFESMSEEGKDIFVTKLRDIYHHWEVTKMYEEWRKANELATTLTKTVGTISDPACSSGGLLETVPDSTAVETKDKNQQMIDAYYKEYLNAITKVLLFPNRSAIQYDSMSDDQKESYDQKLKKLLQAMEQCKKRIEMCRMRADKPQLATATSETMDAFSDSACSSGGLLQTAPDFTGVEMGNQHGKLPSKDEVREIIDAHFGQYPIESLILYESMIKNCSQNE